MQLDFSDSLDQAVGSVDPFLPGTCVQYAWDSTSLGWLKTCPRLYQYKMIEGWRGKGENVHIRFGLEYHKALEDYDVSRCQDVDHDSAVHDVVRGLLVRTSDWASDDKYKNRESLLRTVIWYLDNYKDDAAKVVLLEDGRPAVEHSFRFELDWGPQSGQPYLLCGHLDKVVTYNDELMVMDHKTTSKTPSDYYFNQFEPDNQMTLYTLASRVIFDAPIRGVIIDAAQVMVEGSRFVRSFTYRSPDQLEEWVKDLRYWLYLAEQYAMEEYWPMNDKACRFCEFRGVCSKSPGVREQFLKADFVIEEEERWNPLRVR